MKPVAIVLGLAGLGLATGLVAWQGAGAVADATLAIGWGLLAVVVWEAVPLVLDAYAWRFLLPPEERPPVWVMVWARWIRKSASQLLPLMQIGGDMVGARMLYLRGVPGPLAGGAAVVDLTLAAVGQIAFAMIGLYFLFDRDGSADLVVPLLVASLVLLFGVGCFIVVQHRGLFGFLANRSGKVSGGLVSFSGGAGHLDEAVREVYRRRGDIARNFAWQMASWISSTGEVWIACWFLGYPVSVEEALIIQSLTRAVRAVAFMVPGGIGVQEGGLLVFASVLGLPMEVGLALALIKRVREIAVGVPGLIAWQVAETGRLLSNRTRVAAAPSDQTPSSESNS